MSDIIEKAYRIPMVAEHHIDLETGYKLLVNARNDAFYQFFLRTIDFLTKEGGDGGAVGCKYLRMALNDMANALLVHTFNEKHFRGNETCKYHLDYWRMILKEANEAIESRPFNTDCSETCNPNVVLALIQSVASYDEESEGEQITNMRFVALKGIVSNETFLIPDEIKEPILLMEVMP